MNVSAASDVINGLDIIIDYPDKWITGLQRIIIRRFGRVIGEIYNLTTLKCNLHINLRRRDSLFGQNGIVDLLPGFWLGGTS